MLYGSASLQRKTLVPKKIVPRWPGLATQFAIDQTVQNGSWHGSSPRLLAPRARLIKKGSDDLPLHSPMVMTMAILSMNLECKRRFALVLAVRRND